MTKLNFRKLLQLILPQIVNSELNLNMCTDSSLADFI